MTVIIGPAPVGPPVSIETASNLDHLNGVDWQTEGVSFTPIGCLPAHLQSGGCVPCSDVTDPRFCANDWPESVTFKPFWVYMAANACPLDGVDYLGQIRDELVRQRSAQIAKALHAGIGGNPSLQSAATDITQGNGPSSPPEALAALLRAAGSQGITGGAFYGPAYTVPALLDRRLLTLNGGTYSTTLGLPYISDMGFSTTGPQGAPAPAGTAWVYWSPSRPSVAVDTRIQPPGEWDSRAFFDHSTGCFTPMARQRAIAIFNPCATFAVLMNVADCCPCSPEVPAPVVEDTADEPVDEPTPEVTP